MEDAPPLSYDTLLDLLRMERRSNKLTDLPRSFWEDLRGYLQELEAEFRRQQEKDPFSRRVRMLTDEVTHARDAADALWSLRERKIAIQALAHVRSPGEAKGMLPSERPLYDETLGVLQANRDRIFEGTVAAPRAQAPAATRQAAPTLPHAAPATTPAAPNTPPAGSEDTPRPPAAAPHTAAPPKSSRAPAPHSARQATPPASAPTTARAPTAPPGITAPGTATTPAPDATGLETPSKDEAPAGPVVVPSDTPRTDAVVIRAQGDIPPFVGPDMQTYLLKAGDVATVPKSIADLLVRRQKASVVQEAAA